MRTIRESSGVAYRLDIYFTIVRPHFSVVDGAQRRLELAYTDAIDI